MDFANVTFEPDAAAVVRKLYAIGAEVRVMDARKLDSDAAAGDWLIAIVAPTPLGMLDVLGKLAHSVEPRWFEDGALMPWADEGGWLLVFRALRGHEQTMH